jgi:hypothetical protein
VSSSRTIKEELGIVTEKIALTVVVNGSPTLVEANPNAELRSIIGRALEQTGNIGQSDNNWELRDAAGQVLDLGAKISSFGFGPDTRLFLNLHAGVGG